MVKARTRFTTRGAGGGKGRRAAAWTILAGLTVFTVVALTAGLASAQAPAAPAAAAPAVPDLATRVADLEAYVTNGAPKALASPGPGHNAWMMTSSALVLFMTLPGLALFYGGLVRRKNVLSVLAQCLGCAGLVTILWWAVRLQLRVRARARRSSAASKFAFLKGVTAAPNADYAALGLAERVLDVPADVRDHHAGPDRRRDRRAHEVLGDHGCSSSLWMFVVYFPLAHMVWGIDGLMNGVWNAKADDQGDRLRGRHRRAHVVGLVGAGALPDPRQAHGLRQARVRCRTAWC